MAYNNSTNGDRVLDASDALLNEDIGALGVFASHINSSRLVTPKRSSRLDSVDSVSKPSTVDEITPPTSDKEGEIQESSQAWKTQNAPSLLSPDHMQHSAMTKHLQNGNGFSHINNNTNTLKPFSLPPISPSPLPMNGGSLRNINGVLNDSSAVADKQAASTTTSPRVSAFTLLAAILEQLGGKDRLGKVIQYGLRILLIYSKRSSTFLSTVYEVSDASLNKSGGRFSLLVSLLRRPELLLYWFLKQFEKKATGLSSGLSMYRQMLRAGKTPFRLVNLGYKINDTFQVFKKKGVDDGIVYFRKNWVNEKTVTELAQLYYSWFDESLLCFKLKMIDDPTYRGIATRQERLAWLSTILLTLKKNIFKYQANKRKEQHIRINQQVKYRAKALLSNISDQHQNRSSPRSISNYSPRIQAYPSRMASPSPSMKMALTNSVSLQDTMDAELEALANEQYYIMLDILKGFCDLSFDMVNIFSIQIPEVLHLLFGFGAGSLALTGVVSKTRQELMNKQM
ncbi:BA75_00189T0 [Komagataella pastoris]|uniref:BA75_00189T0 n=1 Tax=Komagataella pastoris TaxID=4922 RepID=A0A1B2J7G0_PICPA|nr:BA75_00189T0 [Komagataella pastoris]